MAAEDKDLNRDPLTDEPGAHPVGTGVGAAGGAVAGAAAGMVGGPVGMAVGGVVGAVVGGLAGHAAAEAVNPTAEEAHWREHYTREPYYEAGRSFDDYGPAYRHGLEGRTRYEDDWDVAEPRLATEWENARAGSSLNWQQARPASRAAWDRVDTQLRTHRGDLSHYGTGLTSTDSTLETSHGMGASASSADVGTTTGTGYAAPSSMGTGSGMGSAMGSTAAGASGAAAAVGAVQSSGDTSGTREDTIDVLNGLIECCKDGEYGFRECAEQARSPDLKSVFMQCAEDCRRSAQELQDQVRACGGKVEDSGSMMGAMHRGWVAVKTKMTTYDDKAVLEEAERGEDNAKARYMKALQKPLPAQVREVVQRQYDGVIRNHDRVKMLRDQARAAG